MPKFRFPSLSTLRSFESAARHQSMKKASRELHVTPAAISHHIERLEKHVGRRLFDRARKAIVLNENGEVLALAVRNGLTAIQSAMTELLSTQEADRLVISVDPDFAVLWLIPRLAEFRAIAPDTLVEILAEKVRPPLDNPRVSCAIHYFEADRNDGTSEVLFRSRLFPVCTGKYAATASLKSMQDLRHQVLLHDRNVNEWRQYLKNAGVPFDLEIKTGTIFSDTAHCLEAAVRGQGVAIGDDCLASIYLSEGRLIKPFGSTWLSNNAYYITILDNATSHPSLDTFRTWLFETIRRQPSASTSE